MDYQNIKPRGSSWTGNPYYYSNYTKTDFSPGDLGHHLKPFVFLDLFSTRGMRHKPNFGMHPHSGIATLTYLIEGAVSYQDSTGEQGILPEGSVEWMQAGNGVWHTGAAAGDASRWRKAVSIRRS